MMQKWKMKGMRTLDKETQKRSFRIKDLQFRSKVPGDEDGSSPVIVEGHAAVFNERTLIEDWYYEEIAPGTFSQDLSDGRDVRCLFNHNWDKILGRRSARTLELDEDEQGLHFIVELPNTTYAHDLEESMRRGDVCECSFLFFPTSQEEDFSLDLPLIRITGAELYEVSIVTLPQYESAKASLRSKQLVRRATKRHQILEKIGGYLNE